MIDYTKTEVPHVWQSAGITGEPLRESTQQLDDSRELSQEVRRSSVSPSESEVGEVSSCGEKNFQSLGISSGHAWTNLLLRSGGFNFNMEEYFASTVYTQGFL